LPREVPDVRWPDGFTDPEVCLPGVLAVQAPPYADAKRPAGAEAAERFCVAFTPVDTINTFPLIVLVDDSDFTAAKLNNWLWVTFTRSNPAADLHGIGAYTQDKHWGCAGSLVIDARSKPHHAPPLEEDPAISRRVEELALPGGPLYRII
jgi:4-hydroxy-3-polyprenylbenzoate decarboxylase